MRVIFFFPSPIMARASKPGSTRRYFEPFYTTKFTGTGLGLAVVNSLVSRSDGVVELLSEPGRGTTVFVLLPGRATEDDPARLRDEGLIDGADSVDRR